MVGRVRSCFVPSRLYPFLSGANDAGFYAGVKTILAKTIVSSSAATTPTNDNDLRNDLQFSLVLVLFVTFLLSFLSSLLFFSHARHAASSHELFLSYLFMIAGPNGERESERER